MRDMLDIWPALPFIIWDKRDYSTMLTTSPFGLWDTWDKTWNDGDPLTKTLAALERSDLVCQINLVRIPNSQLGTVLEAMQVPFPELTSLVFSWNGIEPIQPNPFGRMSMPAKGQVLPDSFLGGFTPRLQVLRLYRFAFPGLPKLLLSATHLVELELEGIPHSGYTSSEVMATAISTLTSLRSLGLTFQSPQSFPGLENRRPPPLTRPVLPLLIFFKFKGVGEYLEDLVAQIDAPRLDCFCITLFNQILFDISQSIQFISRAPVLKAPEKARIAFGGHTAVVSFSSQTSNRGKFNVDVLCGNLDWQISSMEQVCTSCLPFLSTLEALCIHKVSYVSLGDWQNIDNTLWLELLHPFTAVKNLYISREFVPRIGPALQELVGDRITEVLPILQNIFLDGLEPFGPVQEGIGQFIAARQAASHPVVVARWDGDWRRFESTN